MDISPAFRPLLAHGLRQRTQVSRRSETWTRFLRTSPAKFQCRGAQRSQPADEGILGEEAGGRQVAIYEAGRGTPTRDVTVASCDRIQDAAALEPVGAGSEGGRESVTVSGSSRRALQFGSTLFRAWRTGLVIRLNA